MHIHLFRSLRSAWIALPLSLCAFGAFAEVPQTYSLYFDEGVPNWVSFDAIAADPGILGDVASERLLDQLAFLRSERRSDDSCFESGHEEHASSLRQQTAIAAFRTSRSAARTHSSLILEGLVSDLAPGIADGTRIGTLLELTVLAEHFRSPQMSRSLAGQRSLDTLPEKLYIFLPIAQFSWQGEQICVRDRRFKSLPEESDRIAVLLAPHVLSPEERADLVASGSTESTTNQERLVFLEPDTTAVFLSQQRPESLQLWLEDEPAFESVKDLEEWLRAGR